MSENVESFTPLVMPCLAAESFDRSATPVYLHCKDIMNMNNHIESRPEGNDFGVVVEFHNWNGLGSFHFRVCEVYKGSIENLTENKFQDAIWQLKRTIAKKTGRTVFEKIISPWKYHLSVEMI